MSTTQQYLDVDADNEFGAMTSVPGLIKLAIVLADVEGRTVRFKANGQVFQIAADSDPDLIYRDYLRANEGGLIGSVGPHPEAELSEIDLAVDRLNRAEKRLRTKQRELIDAEREYNQAAESLSALSG